MEGSACASGVADFESAFAVAEQIPGWLMPNEAERLYRLGYDAEWNVLEIGTYFGKSTYLIARGIRDAGKPFKLVTVDVHFRGIDAESGRAVILVEDAPTALLRSLREHALADVVIHMMGWSHVCVPLLDFATIGAVFIDGGHEYEDVSRDYLRVRERLVSGTLLLFHDYDPTFPGVRRVVDELVVTDPGYEPIDLTHSLFQCRITTATGDGQRHAELTRLRHLLVAEREARQRCEREAFALSTSTSWRMTAPIRWGLDRLRGWG